MGLIGSPCFQLCVISYLYPVAYSEGEDLLVEGSIVLGVRVVRGIPLKKWLQIQLISHKRYLECTLVQWRLSIYP